MALGKNVFLVLLLIVCIAGSQTLLISHSQEPVQKSDSSILCELVELQTDYFTEQDPIRIESNEDLEDFSSSGTGDRNNPFILERLGIASTGTQNGSIIIRHTSLYFIIRDCYLTTDWVGIEVRYVGDGTARIENNTCISTSGDGAGIVVWGVQNCSIIDNRCSNLAQGIHLNEAGTCYIASNNITNNNYQGINIRYSSSNLITANLISNSSQHGVALVGTSNHNVIHHNQFGDNGIEQTYRIDGEARGELTSQGFDEGYNNTWFDAASEEGNWWSDYSGSGPYVMDGTSDSVDIYPNGNEDQSESTELDPLYPALVLLFSGGFVILVAWRLLRKPTIKT